MLLERSETYHLSILTGIFVLVNGLLYWKVGVSVDDDTERFMTYAQKIRERGIFFKPHDFWYLTYPLFIILMTSIHDSLGAIVLGQVLFSYVALVSLYFSAIRLFQNPKAGLMTGVLFLGFVMVSFWNFWIYCESLLISLNCLAFYFLINWNSRFLVVVLPLVFLIGGNQISKVLSLKVQATKVF